MWRGEGAEDRESAEDVGTFANNWVTFKNADRRKILN